MRRYGEKKVVGKGNEKDQLVFIHPWDRISRITGVARGGIDPVRTGRCLPVS